ncbi:hypothetical protein D9M72_553400 [compost metagenome]
MRGTGTGATAEVTVDTPATTAFVDLTLLITERTAISAGFDIGTTSNCALNASQSDRSIAVATSFFCGSPSLSRSALAAKVVGITCTVLTFLVEAASTRYFVLVTIPSLATKSL